MHAKIGEFACTRGPVLGTPALAEEAPWRKTQQAQENQQVPGTALVCAGAAIEIALGGLNFNDI